MSAPDARFTDKPLADEACKTGGMIGTQADVFVQVKQFDACPIDGRSGNHAREEFDLCRSGSRYDSSLPPLRNCLPNSNDGVFGRSLGGKLGGSNDALCHGAFNSSSALTSPCVQNRQQAEQPVNALANHLSLLCYPQKQ